MGEMGGRMGVTLVVQGGASRAGCCLHRIAAAQSALRSPPWRPCHELDSPEVLRSKPVLRSLVRGKVNSVAVGVVSEVAGRGLVWLGEMLGGSTACRAPSGPDAKERSECIRSVSEDPLDE